MTPRKGKYCSLSFLPATPSSLSQTLKGPSEQTPRPSRALDSPHALLPELQTNKNTLRCAALGEKVPGHRQEQLSQTLIGRFQKMHFLHLSIIVKSQQNRVNVIKTYISPDGCPRFEESLKHPTITSELYPDQTLLVLLQQGQLLTLHSSLSHPFGQ